MDALKSTLANLGMARIALMMGILIGLIAFFIYIMTRISAPDMGLLYSNLDLSESGQIVQKLEAMNVPVDVRGEGTQIFVPKDQVGRSRMMLAEAGLPSGGSVGYEIFDKSDGLGTSSFVQDVNLVRALEGELARTIGTIKGIKGARVHLVLPKRELFSRERQNASASVFLNMTGSKRLTKTQVLSIRQLVAAAIPGLLTQHVSVVDDHGTLLAKGDGDETAFSSASTSDELRYNFERNLAKNLETLLESTLGPNKAKVEVSALIDYDKATQNEEIFNPEGQVARSVQTVSDTSHNTTQNGAQAEAVENNLPDDPNAGGNAQTSGQKSARQSETTNFEISKTLRTHVKESGELKRLSVAVLVDGNYKTDNEGNKTYEPRSDADIQQINRLIKSAIGFDEDRGDKVEVVNMQFFQPKAPALDAEEETYFGFDKAEVMRMIEILVLGIVGILVLLLIIRPIVNRLLEGPRGNDTALPGAPGGLPYAGAGAPGALPTAQQPGPGNMPTPSLPAGYEGAPLPGQPGMAPVAGGAPLPSGGAAASGGGSGIMQNISGGGANYDPGQVQSAVKQIEGIVDTHPEEAATIIRSWMHEGPN